MRAVMWLGPRQMQMEELPPIQPAAHEALIAVEAVGICGSELSGYLGQSSIRVPPLVMGHEFAGRVVQLGAQAQGLAIGDLVAVNPLVTCGVCQACTSGHDNLCPQRALIGAHRPGAFAEYVAAPALNCHPVSPALGPVVAALTEPLGCGVRAARLGNVGPGTRVMVVGAGTIGLMCIAAVRHAGGRVVLVSDVHPDRLATAQHWGAENICDTRTTDPAALAYSLCDGRGADVVIEAVGLDVTRQSAVASVRLGGTIVLLGLHEAESPLAINHIVRSEIQLIGSFSYTIADFAQALHMITNGVLQPDSSWLEERPLEACQSSFDQLIDAPPAIAKIMLRPTL